MSFKPREILVSGTKEHQVFDFLNERFDNVVRLDTCESSNAAYGAAVLADGLSGGQYSDIIDLIKIREASGSNLDYTEFECPKSLN
jgi:predicted butyrate kinase (DUF1464 family)